MTVLYRVNCFSSSQILFYQEHPRVSQDFAVGFGTEVVPGDMHSDAQHTCRAHSSPVHRSQRMETSLDSRKRGKGTLELRRMIGFSPALEAWLVSAP